MILLRNDIASEVDILFVNKKNCGQIFLNRFPTLQSPKGDSSPLRGAYYSLIFRSYQGIHHKNLQRTSFASVPIINKKFYKGIYI